MFKIQFESAVISDIIKILFELKASFQDNVKIMENMGLICDTDDSRADLDAVLGKYIQSENFSDYYYLAYYLDPRYKNDKNFVEDPEVKARVLSVLERYSNSLGCGLAPNEPSLASFLDDFRGNIKIFRSSSDSTKSPSGYWDDLHRYQIPGVTQLAYCARRLLSISTRALQLATQSSNDAGLQSTSGLSSDKLDSHIFEQLLPIKDYLRRKISPSHADRSAPSLCLSTESLAQTVSHVITTLDAFDGFLQRHSSGSRVDNKNTASSDD